LNTLVVKLEGHTGPVQSSSFSRNGPLIVTSGADHTARVWNASDGKRLLILDGHKGPVLYAVFSPDGRRVITASEDHTARFWDALTGAKPQPFYHRLP
jgi:WD40 repeat protein